MESAAKMIRLDASELRSVSHDVKQTDCTALSPEDIHRHSSQLLSSAITYLSNSVVW